MYKPFLPLESEFFKHMVKLTIQCTVKKLINHVHGNCSPYHSPVSGVHIWGFFEWDEQLNLLKTTYCHSLSDIAGKKDFFLNQHVNNIFITKTML